MTKTEFRNRWLEQFASAVSARDIQNYVVDTGDRIWHVFSFGLLEAGTYLQGKDAEAAFDKADKRGAIYLDETEGEHTCALTWEFATADALSRMCEVYVAAADFSWTYIKTHESTCGPYFMKK